MKKLGLLLLMTAVFTISGTAQKSAKKGDFTFLKGQKSLNVEYDYSNMKVGKNLTEEKYVNDKVKEYNKKESGKGDKFKEGWEGSRAKRYEPKFETLINKSLAKSNMKVAQGADAKYTLVVKTVYTEPGFNVGVMKKPASVNFEFIFKDASGKQKAKYILDNVPGAQAMGYDFDAGSRIAECYAKGGKMLGSYIAKDLK